MKKIHCAALDERGVFRGMVDVEAAVARAAPALYLPAITSCDLPAGQYRWAADPAQPMGGSFLPLPRAQRAAAGRPTIEHALAFDYLARWRAGDALPGVCLAWLDDALRSVDFAAFRDLPDVVDYAAERCLTFTRGA